MRILFGSWPAYGHLLPTVPLIRAAQRAGHDVLVSSGSGMAGPIGQLGVPAHRSGVTLDESYARMPDQTTISQLPIAERPGFAVRHLFGAGAVDRARDPLELMDTWRPELVVHDTLELGSPTAAIMWGIAAQVTHGYGPIIPATQYFAAAIGSAVADAGLADPPRPCSPRRTSRSARPGCVAPNRIRGPRSLRRVPRPSGPRSLRRVPRPTGSSRTPCRRRSCSRCRIRTRST